MRGAVEGLLSEGVRHIAAVGGDGTLNVVADAIHASTTEPVTISIVPAGTGSDFARTFGLPQDLESSVERLNHSTDYPIDLGVLEGSWGTRAFLNIADAGLAAACVRTADRLPRGLGAAKYQIAFWATLPLFRAAQVRLVTPRRTVESRAIAVVLANGQFFGGGLNVAPRAATMDGLLDVQLIDARVRDAPALFPKLKRGLHLGHRAVRRLSTPTVRLEADRPWPIEADGELIGEAPVDARLAQGRLAVRL